MKTLNRKSPHLFGLIFILAALCLSSTCQRTVIRNGVRVPADVALQGDLSEGDQAFEEGRYDDAITAYYRILSDFPRSDQAPYAMLRVGQSYVGKGDCESATMYLDEVMSKYPRSSEADEAALTLAECAVKNRDCASAIDYLEPRRDRAQGETWDRMTLVLAACAEQNQHLESAVKYYAEEANKGTDDKSIDTAATKIDDLLGSLDDDTLLGLADDYPSGYPGDAALMEMIRRSVNNEDYDTASECLVRLERDYPASPYLKDLDDLKDMIKRRVRVKPYRIGLILPLSGRLKPLGEQALQGALLAANVFDPNAGFKPELIIKDTGDSAANIEQVVDDLVNVDQVVAIVGPMLRSHAEKAAARAQTLRTPLISLSPGEEICDLGDMIYQNSLNKSEQVEVLVDHAVADLEITKFGILYPGTSYGSEYAKLFIEQLNKRGLAAEHVQSYAIMDGEDKKTDFKDEIKAFKKTGVKAIFIPDSYDRVIMIAPQIRYYLYKELPLLGINSWHSEQLLMRIQPEDLAEAFFTDAIAPEAEMPLFKQFTRNFSAQYQRNPGIIEAQAYEAVDLALSLIRVYRVRDRVQFKEALDHVKDYPGVTGTITVEPNGKFRKPIYLFTIKDRQFVVVRQYQ